MQMVTLSDLENMSEEQLNTLCFHLTSMSAIDSIDNNGLVADIGINSSGNLGKEKTKKVFFSKGYAYALSIINRAMDIVNRVLDSGDMETIEKLGLDPTLDAKSNILMLLDKKAYYLLNIKGVSREEYEKMPDEERAGISYLTDDLDEETGKTMEDANMHTISGLGVPKELMVKVVDDNYDVVNSTEVIKALARKFKEFHSDMELPTRNQSVNYLEQFYDENVISEGHHI